MYDNFTGLIEIILESENEEKTKKELQNIAKQIIEQNKHVVYKVKPKLVNKIVEGKNCWNILRDRAKITSMIQFFDTIVDCIEDLDGRIK